MKRDGRSLSGRAIGMDLESESFLHHNPANFLSHNTEHFSVEERYASLTPDATRSRAWIAFAIIFAVLVIDQVLKIWVKTHMYLGQSHEIFPWFQIAFIQNNGMAFGWEIGSKLLLTLLRIVTVGFLIFYICRIFCRRIARTGYIVCLSLIIAGAAGNIIDCAFYGLIFNNPMPPQVAELFPPDGGYGTFLHGKVVDMLYFPLFHWTWPEWMPFVGGEYFLFFSPVFNIADASISVGLIALLIFYSWQIGAVPVRREPTARELEGAKASDDAGKPEKSGKNAPKNDDRESLNKTPKNDDRESRKDSGKDS